jgi:NAD(P)-dependent dehydrogenase (short-subunit alcohol dehydrogenase family)
VSIDVTTAASSASDRVVVVTGATGGLGLELARRLARLGAHVVLACRNPPRAERARELVLSESVGARATVLPLDVAEPASIREFGTRFSREVGHLDILINNAAIFGGPLSYNSAGHELQLATNYLGPFALVGVLLPAFRDRPGARIVNVGSLAHLTARSSVQELDSAGRYYGAWRAYAHSKWALATYTLELNRRLRGRHVIAVGAHPGFAPSDLSRNMGVASRGSPIGRFIIKTLERSLHTIVEAATPVLHAACAEGVRGGEYYGPGGWLEVAGPTAKARLHPGASNQEVATRQWSASETLTGVSYLSPGGAS